MAECTPVLYSYYKSSCSWRVRIALNWKGIDYEYVPVNLIKDGGQQKSTEYAEKNPMQQVPTLVVNDDQSLTQSLAILEYLEDVYPSPTLMPGDALSKAKVREVCNIIASGIQPFQSASVLRAIGDEKKMEWGKTFITKGFVALEKVLTKYAGKYCVGDIVTLADTCLVPQVYNAIRYSVDMSVFPAISRIYTDLLSLEAFKMSHPSRMIDCPEEHQK